MAASTDWIDKTTATRMRSFFNTLSEKDQRRYAAMEAQRLGHGGISHVAGILGCSTKTISCGIDELDTLDDDPAPDACGVPELVEKKDHARLRGRAEVAFANTNANRWRSG